ncbi:hypothetical protein FQN57_003641 [Myotisia sp. PD_48]|nr:hypothetical protein FQN57_003641 [Myotisia sp. PD_48]
MSVVSYTLCKRNSTHASLYANGSLLEQLYNQILIFDVRLHTECNGHALRYVGWTWACQNSSEYQAIKHTPLHYPEIPQLAPDISVSRIAYNLDDENQSQNSTRQILTWLRVGGFPLRESGIYKHEWLQMNFSDDDEGFPDNNSEISKKISVSIKKVEEWDDQST